MVAAVANNCGCKRFQELSAGFQGFADRLRAARVVVARMNALLIDGRSGAKNTERVEEMHVVALLRQTDCDCGSIDPSPRNSNICAHTLD